MNFLTSKWSSIRLLRSVFTKHNILQVSLYLSMICSSVSFCLVDLAIENLGETSNSTRGGKRALRLLWSNLRHCNLQHVCRLPTPPSPQSIFPPHRVPVHSFIGRTFCPVIQSIEMSFPYWGPYMQKAGDSWDISPQFFLDFPQNFRLRTRNQYCTQAIAWGSTI